MKYRTLGRTGVSVSEIGFGAWALGGGWGDQPEQQSLAALNEAIDLGVNFIDTAAGYGDGRSERLIGRVLQERGLSYPKVVVATKTPPDAGPWPPSPYCVALERYSEKYLRKNIEQRLRNLRTDCLDVLQLHTWTRAWNRDPRPMALLRKFQKQGKIRQIGISTPEQDQNAAVDLIRDGWVDTVQVIYNIFEQEPAAELLPAARQHKVGIIVRVAFDEGALTGRFTRDTKFPEGDFRRRYFQGDRLTRAVDRAERVKKELKGTRYTLAQAALRFVLDHPAVSTVIPGIRNVKQAEMNLGATDLKPLPAALTAKLRKHQWQRGFWYAGK
jgi:aryl-alcohol dehydrogenase-like predicted oxidoreductase